jgi:hypothetical protein
MLPRHRKKAFLGLACWSVLFAVFVALFVISYNDLESHIHLRAQTTLLLILANLLVLYGCFFWATYHLARSKGYPGATALLGIFGPVAQLLTLAGLLWMRDKHSPHASHRQNRRHRVYASPIERIVIARRNAVVGIVFGFFGVALGALLVLFRWGIFQDHDNEEIVGFGIFVVGYVGVIFGCRSWLKAKDWIDAVIFIGLMPFAIFFVPWVRVIWIRLIRSTPLLLPTGMAMMTMILIVVVAVLPDKSGWPQRQRWRVRKHGVLRLSSLEGDGDSGREDSTRGLNP